MLKVRPAELSDIKSFWDHQTRHGLESGQDGDLIFSPYEGLWDRGYEDFEKQKRTTWSKPIDEPGWQRSWVVTDANGVYGELTLAHQPPVPSCLHRAMLMMGIERSHRGQGWGAKLMTTAIDWAKGQPSLDWLQLYVFEHNQPARALYRKFGFEEIGATPDMFRIYGTKVADISMALKLRPES